MNLVPENIIKNFDEDFYLGTYPDVAVDVESGVWESGLEHFLKYGFIENRRHCASDAHFIRDYERLVNRLLAEHPDNKELALAKAIGSHSMEEFKGVGDLQVNYLKILGLKESMSVYDLACGCGRTAQALIRDGWIGSYTGADIIKSLVDHLNESCPKFKAFVHRDLTIRSPNDMLDIIFSWSLFTHLQHEEIFLYMQDSFRALRSGGKLIFSFLEHQSPDHQKIFFERVKGIANHGVPSHLDTFLHRDFINQWAKRIGFIDNVGYINGDVSIAATLDPFFQSLAILTKP